MVVTSKMLVNTSLIESYLIILYFVFLYFKTRRKSVEILSAIKDTTFMCQKNESVSS